MHGQPENRMPRVANRRRKQKVRPCTS